MIALASSNPAPVVIGHRGALLALELAEQAATAAHREFVCCPLGDTPLLLQRSAAWRAAEAAVGRAALRERAERFRARGQAWLREVSRG